MVFRVPYERQRLELTALHSLVRQRAATYFEQVEAGDGADPPHFVKNALDAIFDWDIWPYRSPAAMAPEVSRC